MRINKSIAKAKKLFLFTRLSALALIVAMCLPIFSFAGETTKGSRLNISPAGESFSSAKPIPLNTTVQGILLSGSSAEERWYSFSIPQRGIVTVNFTFFNPVSDLRPGTTWEIKVFNSNHVGLQSMGIYRDRALSNDLPRIEIEKGVYFICVDRGYTGYIEEALTLNYTIRVEFDNVIPQPQPSTPQPQPPATENGAMSVNRLYNPILDKYLLSTDPNEAAVLSRNYGWANEGIKFRSVSPGSSDAVAVTRLYNPALGRHLYSMDRNEINELSRNWGWNDEGTVLYCALSSGSGKVGITRLFNPRTSCHVWSTDQNEIDTFRSRGWNIEGIAFYGVGVKSETQKPNADVLTVDEAAEILMNYLNPEEPDDVAWALWGEEPGGYVFRCVSRAMRAEGGSGTLGTFYVKHDRSVNELTTNYAEGNFQYVRRY